MVYTCKGCGQAKPTDDFYPHPGTANKLNAHCKECHKIRVRVNRSAKIEKYREHDRQRANNPSRVLARAMYSKTSEGKAAKRKASDSWNDRNKTKRSATVVLNNAVKYGKVVPQPCFTCGEKAHAHHPSYAMPLDVAWLCPKHHAQLHKEFRAMQSDSRERPAL